MSAKKSLPSHDSDTVHKPSKEFSAKARIPSLAAYKKLYQESIAKPDKFWAGEAKELLWQKPWTKVLDWKAPNAKWFEGGKLNVCENCVTATPSARAGIRRRSSGRASRATNA